MELNKGNPYFNDNPASAPLELNKEVIKDWCAQTTGEFHYKAVLDGKYEKTKITFDRLRKAIRDLVQDGILAKAHSKKDGYYRLMDKADEEVLWWEGEDLDDNHVNLLLPFGLHKACYIPRPALIIISGDTNAGKSAIIDNILNLNLEKFDEIKVLKSEGLDLFRDKMKNYAVPKCPIPPPFKTFKKQKNFEDDVLPDGLTLVDYLRPPNPESLMSIGAPLEAMVAKLDTGILAVTIQKPRGERGEGFGGIVTQWDASLSISIHSTSERYVSYLKLNKIKKPLILDRDLYHLKIRFRMRHGIQLEELEKVYE